MFIYRIQNLLSRITVADIVEPHEANT